ncbi:hypothetical protein Pmani_006455 [Petrolisthes manimaculis]|uniref:Uncharacterized protein n=1 Tax=Petrolisthes manimaculis TaxID=1843537 RepID=A0AAE1UGF7_9EUCA|nr:hypothetical protein Pmani_006455 [Petrolisthes manimaculis]
MSKEMQEAKKSRAAAKGWVTRSVKELQDLFDDDTTSFELLDAAVSVFDHRLAAFDEQQTAVELLLEDDTDLEADMDEYRDGEEDQSQTIAAILITIFS